MSGGILLWLARLSLIVPLLMILLFAVAFLGDSEQTALILAFLIIPSMLYSIITLLLLIGAVIYTRLKKENSSPLLQAAVIHLAYLGSILALFASVG